MKVSPLTTAFTLVRDAVRGSGASDRDKKRDSNKDSQKDDGSNSDENIDEFKVKDALTEFSKDAQAAANGLQASFVGGPGLTVVLKDGSGGVLRQYSGEEFVRMRESIAQTGRLRGKLLDQKA